MAFLKPLSRSRVVDPRGPSVVCGKFRYVAVDRHALWPYDGKPVMVKFDNVNANRCFVFSLDGKFLTECRRPEYVPYFARTDEERGRLSAALKRRESERQELKALIMSETKGFHKLDPATIYLLDAETLEQGARLQLIDRRTSVKGETHNPAIYAAPVRPHRCRPLLPPRRCTALLRVRPCRSPRPRRSAKPILTGSGC